MRLGINLHASLLALLLAGSLGHAQTAAPTENPGATSAHWQDGLLEVMVDGASWSHTIPFKALASSRSDRHRFANSTITAEQHMRPDGLNRTAQAQFKGQTWLRWGEGTAPLALDSPAGWPYRLVADLTTTPGKVQYRWSNADASQYIKARPNTVQRFKTPNATWCAWFSVTGAPETRPGIADGNTPRIRWMLWQRPKNATCCK
ncbi:MAG: hypothetical protein U5M53_09495 [Rhodoferax sp.]|nr:hypothetical protein [Rhodoferax sp.]